MRPSLNTSKLIADAECLLSSKNSAGRSPYHLVRTGGHLNAIDAHLVVLKELM